MNLDRKICPSCAVDITDTVTQAETCPHCDYACGSFETWPTLEQIMDESGIEWDEVDLGGLLRLLIHECEWREDAEGNWHTGCGGQFVLFDDTPSLNDMAWCCYCGGLLVEVLYHEPTMDSTGDDQ